MALVAFSPSRSGPQDDLLPFERLVVRLSSCFSSIRADEIKGAVARALEEAGVTFALDECTLIAYRDTGNVRVVQSWAAPPNPVCSDADLREMPWLVRRLARNTVVAMTPMTDVPHAAARDLAHAARSGVVARLAVPVVVGPRVAYGLIAGSRQRQADWSAPVIERLRLVGEILGGGLARVGNMDAAGVRHAAAGQSCDSEGPAATAADRTREPAGTQLIIGDSAPLRLALARLGQVAPLDATVMLLGETGTGKELFARALHNASRRRGRSLVCVNCAALPANLIESELFGHERGAFTGAASMRQGRFELADEGTIFLDEIGDLAPELQTKLLRVLQEGEFERVGSSKMRRVNTRVIAATHVDLETAVAEGRFRADLYYRLSVFPITLPTLRDRPEDIPQLVWCFIHRQQQHLGRRITTVPDAVMDALQRHDWPGNVRELENVIARAMIGSPGGTLQLDDPLRVDSRRPFAAAPIVPVAASLLPSQPECGDSLDAVQRRHIERVLRECGWRINGAGNAAVRLGMHPNTLRFRIKKLGVMIPERKRVDATGSSGVRPG